MLTAKGIPCYAEGAGGYFDTLEIDVYKRQQIVIIRDRDYNLASRCLGTGTFRIILKNLLPYLVSVITRRRALAIPGAIGSEVFVTYIGLGLPADMPSLGNLINEGRKLITSPSLRYQLIFPAIVLSIITIAFYIIGNAFADAADPKNPVSYTHLDGYKRQMFRLSKGA